MDVVRTRKTDASASSVRTTAAVIIAGSMVEWRALERTLSKDSHLKVLPSHETGDDILAVCRRFTPCVLLLDMATLEAVNSNLIMKSTDLGRSIQILVRFASEPRMADIERVLVLGCMGVLGPTASPSTWLSAVRAAQAGQVWGDRQLLSELLLRYVRGASGALTRREAEILQFVYDGCTNSAIAERLFISRETVRWHLKTIYGKLGFTNRPVSRAKAAGGGEG